MLSADEGTIRTLVFLGTLGGFSLLEAAFPRQRNHLPLPFRRTHNILLTILNTVVLRLVVPFTPYLAAEWGQAHSAGLLHQSGLPVWLKAVLGLAILDLLVYGQHVLFHWNPMLWRLHRVHHSDRVLDASTALRFHLGEVFLSMVLKSLTVVVLGILPWVIILFEIMLNSAAIFNHSNLRIPPVLERPLRLVLVTPDLHRIHHSIRSDEMHHNFGFSIIWWDWLFRTYLPRAAQSAEELMVGLDEFPPERSRRIDQLLLQPFRNSSTKNPPELPD